MKTISENPIDEDKDEAERRASHRKQLTSLFPIVFLLAICLYVFYIFPSMVRSAQHSRNFICGFEKEMLSDCSDHFLISPGKEEYTYGDMDLENLQDIMRYYDVPKGEVVKFIDDHIDSLNRSLEELGPEDALSEEKQWERRYDAAALKRMEQAKRLLPEIPDDSCWLCFE